MKKILSIIALLVSVVAEAQVPTPPGNVTYFPSQRMDYGSYPYIFALPGRGAADTSWKSQQWRKTGNTVIDSVNKKVYVWTGGTNPYWKELGSGGDSGLFGRTDTRNASGSALDFSNAGLGGLLDSLSSADNEFFLQGYGSDGDPWVNAIGFNSGSGGLNIQSQNIPTTESAYIDLSPYRVSLNQSGNTHQIIVSSDSIKIFQSIFSPDTTTFKPLGVSPTGGIARMNRWPGSGSGGSAIPGRVFYVLVSGQSNSWGATGPTALDTARNTQSFIWQHAQATPAYVVNTINQRPNRTEGYNSLNGGNTRSDLNGSTNHAFYFAKEYLKEHPYDTVKIVSAQADGTSINSWWNGGAQRYLDSLTTRAIAAAMPRVDLFIWDQGESDTGMDEQLYNAKWDSMKAYLRTFSWFAPTTKIAVVGLLKSYGGKDTTLMKRDRDADVWDGYVNTMDAGTWAGGEAVHFGDTGIKLLGDRIYATWKSLPYQSGEIDSLAANLFVYTGSKFAQRKVDPLISWGGSGVFLAGTALDAPKHRGGTAIGSTLRLFPTTNATPNSSSNTIIQNYDGGTTAIHIDNGARVGIGAAPGATSLLHVQTANSSYFPFRVDWTGANPTAFAVVPAGNTIYLQGNATVSFTGLASTTPRLSITTGGLVGVNTVSPDRILHSELNGGANTNAMGYPLRLTQTSTGTVTTGFGAGIEFELENGSNTNRVAGLLDVVWTDAGNATEDADLSISLYRAGVSTEALRLLGTGDLAIKRIQNTSALDSVLVQDGGLVKYIDLSGATGVTSGTYTATITAGTNTASATQAYDFQYTRIGNIVTFSGYVQFTPTLANTNSTFGISLPIASNFSGAGQAFGVLNNSGAQTGGVVDSDGTNDRLQVLYYPTTTNAVNLYIVGQYRVI